MEPIKDLELLIAETERAANLFGMLNKLPRVLEVIQKAQNLPDELKREIHKLQGEVRELELQGDALIESHDELQEDINAAQLDLENLKMNLDVKKQDLLNKMDEEVKAAREDANRALQESSQKVNDRLEKNEAIIKESEDKMIEAIKFHRGQIDVHKAEEKKVKKAVNDYKALLEKIKSL